MDRLAQGERALRLDRSGALVEMAGLPAAPAAIKPDPRFGSGDGPLRAALRSGVRSGPWTAVIGAGGDVIRVDLATGAIASTSPGVVPLRMACEAMEIPDDIALVCAERGKVSVVVTHVLHGREPRVERSFPTDGPFYAGDGGALAYGGPCGPLPSEAPAASAPSSAAAPPAAPAPPLPSVCVRNGDGQWEPFVLDEEAGKPRAASPGRRDKGAAGASGASAPTADPAAPVGGKQGARTPAAAASGTSSGAPPPRIRAEDVRWIPRAGRAPVAVIAGKELASYDSAWGEVRPWQAQGAARDLVDAARRHAAPRHDSQLIDQRWAATSAGAVQALLDDGRAIEVSPDGVITVWPFTFDRVAVAGAGAGRIARSDGGRPRRERAQPRAGQDQERRVAERRGLEAGGRADHGDLPLRVDRDHVRVRRRHRERGRAGEGRDLGDPGRAEAEDRLLAGLTEREHHQVAVREARRALHDAAGPREEHLRARGGAAARGEVERARARGHERGEQLPARRGALPAAGRRRILAVRGARVPAVAREHAVRHARRRRRDRAARRAERVPRRAAPLRPRRRAVREARDLGPVARLLRTARRTKKARPLRKLRLHAQAILTPRTGARPGSPAPSSQGPTDPPRGRSAVVGLDARERERCCPPKPDARASGMPASAVLISPSALSWLKSCTSPSAAPPVRICRIRSISAASASTPTPSAPTRRRSGCSRKKASSSGWTIPSRIAA